MKLPQKQNKQKIIDRKPKGNPPGTFAVITLGCPKNTVDSELLIGALSRGHLRQVADPAQAETVIVNTCGFIQPAKSESIETILEAARLKQSGVRKLLAVGCLAQRYASELKAGIPELDGVFGVDAQAAIVQELTGTKTEFDYEFGRRLLTPRHFAYLKIAEGCDNQCSFCAIPLIRGRQISRDPESLLREAAELARRGVKELILIAQDLTRYGSDLKPRIDLYQFLERLLQAQLFPWVRLIYANPDFWKNKLNRLFEKYPQLCPYLDIPVQHCSSRILEQMQRGSDRTRMIRRLQALRHAVPHIALRTSIMVGFPGESVAEFQELLDFVREMRFERLGVFTYSAEEGTAAFGLRDNIPAGEKERRKEILMQVQWEIAHDFALSKVGQEIPILLERRLPDGYSGRSIWDAPEVDCTVRLQTTKLHRIGSFCHVKLSGVEGLDWTAMEV